MKKFYLFALLLLPFFTISVYSQSYNDSNDYCLQCHSMQTLSVRDNDMGVIKNLSIDVKAYKESHHGALLCVDCHSEDFAKIPHPKKLKNKKLKCANCHDEDLTIKGKSFKKIRNEFHNSIHYQTMGDDFSCTNCHDPHTLAFQKSLIPEVNEKVIPANQRCVECHDLKYKFREGDPQRVNLRVVHEKEIKEDKNWDKKKCVDCHASNGKGSLKHNIKSVEYSAEK
jgi:Zn finger protein HypA/HybF involved in hydrogenase expression